MCTGVVGGGSGGVGCSVGVDDAGGVASGGGFGCGNSDGAGSVGRSCCGSSSGGLLVVVVAQDGFEHVAGFCWRVVLRCWNERGYFLGRFSLK